jgi:hypothetical protein
MRDKLTRRGQYRGKRYNRHNFFIGRVVRHSNVNVDALDVTYKSISHFYFLKVYLKHHIKVEVTGNRQMKHNNSDLGWGLI